MKTRRVFLSAAALMACAGLAKAQINENFDNMSAPPGTPGTMFLTGWTFQNSANPPGGTGMYQGAGLGVFDPYASTGFLAANFNNCTGTNTISTWAVSPEVLLTNGARFAFATRTVSSPAFPDRLQIRMSTAGSSTNVGALGDPTAVGDFSTLLLDINPNYLLNGYPNVWTEYAITLSGLPVAGVNGRFAIRYFVEGGGPTGANSDFIGVDEVAYPALTGACCFPDGSCQSIRQAGCLAQGGNYAGDNVTCAAANCPQPATGRCCFTNGTCTVLSQLACTAAGGAYAGDNTACSAGICPTTGWIEVGEAGELPASAQIVAGSGAGSLLSIQGTLAASDADMYQINVCDAANFSASTVGLTSVDTQLFMFKTDGTGLVFDDDEATGFSLQSALTSAFVAPAGNGLYYLAISGWDKDALGVSTVGELWFDTPYNVERAPDGPAAAEAIGSWSGGGGAGAYTIALTGSCFVGGSFGACCFGAPSYSCSVSSQTACVNAGGTYVGDGTSCPNVNCPQPPTGRCCLITGSCSVLTQAQCSTQNGVYGGDNTSCGTCPLPWVEAGEASDLPANAQVVSGSGSLPAITGALGTGDADMYRISVCDANNFRATTLGFSTVDTQLFMFKLDGTGLTCNDDSPAPAVGLQSTIGSSIVGPAGNGEYYLAISQWDKDPLGVTTVTEIWLDTPFNTERAPDGPAASEAIGSWSVTTGAGGSYGIKLTGACYIGGCYANCDGSTGTPALTANDFQCFINQYAAQTAYANCDGSTGTPALTANDFQCFINEYAGGCP